MAKNVKNIEVKIDGKEWNSILDTVFKKKQKDLKIDGFRKGSVPKDIYLKKFGLESLFMDAVDAAIPVAYKKGLAENNVIPVIEPSVDIKKIDENEVVFEFVIMEKPAVKLGKYKDLKIKREEPVVSKEELDAEIDALRTKLAEIVIKDKGEVAFGNTAVIDFKGVVDGKELEGGSGENYPLEIGSNTFIPGFEDGLIGVKVGETKELKLKFPDNYTEELKNKEVVFTVTIREIKERILPEINEDLYKDLGYDDVKDEKEFRQVVEGEVKKRKQVDIEDKYVEACLAKAADNMSVEINEEIISEEVHRMIHQYEEQLKMQGLTIDQYLEFSGLTHEDLHTSMNPEATKRVKYRYLIEAVAEEEKIEVTDKEADEEATKVAEQYGIEKPEFIQMIGGLEMMKYDCKMRKAMEIIKGA